MNEKEKLLKRLARKTMFDIQNQEMNEFINEYDRFMSYVDMLEKIETKGIMPLAFPYEIETSFLREDESGIALKQEEVLKNAKSVMDGQIKVPKVVG